MHVDIVTPCQVDRIQDRPTTPQGKAGTRLTPQSMHVDKLRQVKTALDAFRQKRTAADFDISGQIPTLRHCLDSFR